jgi:tRNA (guanine-N7-)-methyltransferase
VRARQHVNPLGLGFETFRGERPDIPNGSVVECEIGCADAQFLFERARSLPPERRRRHRFVGVEIREHLVVEVNERAAAEDLPITAVFCNACHHLDKLFEPGQVSVIYINFPDPWFKRRHRKRRMVTAELLDQCCRALAPGGQLLFQSDVWPVALEALALCEGTAALVNQAGAWSFWKQANPFGARSWREANCEANDLPIWRLLYRHD